MSVLVKGMDMPRHCGECGIDWCYICRRAETPIETRPSDCPLVEVPTPHGDLIDRDSLRDNNCDAFEIKGADGTILAMDVSIIDDAPTIIPADMPTYEEEEGET